MNPHSAHWHPAAAYLYILHLDDPSLAWEYLRRNPGYRRDWQQRHHKQSSPRHWYLRHFEDPDCDARCAQPAWLAEVDTAIPLHIDDDPPQDAPRFCLWNIPGYKTLTEDGHRPLHAISTTTKPLPSCACRRAPWKSSASSAAGHAFASLADV